MSSHSAHGQLTSSGHALTVSGWLTGIYFFIELAIGLYSGSVAVISDAFHTFSAVGGVVLAIVAARLARRPADPAKTFGWYRAEIVGALINGAFLLIMALVVIAMGVIRLKDPIEVPTAPMLIAAAGGLLTEVVSLYLLYRRQAKDLNVRGAYWHVLQTFVGSIIIIVAALVIKFTGFMAIDPILGVAFGFVLLWASWGIMRDAIHLLMEGTPSDVDLSEIVDALLTLDGVEDAHHVHAWALTSDKYVFSAHLRLQAGEGRKVGDVQMSAHGILREKFGFYFTTIQVESRCLDEDHAQAIDTPVMASIPLHAHTPGMRHE